MAVTFTERPESRRVRYGISGGGETIILNGRGSNDQVELYNAVLAIPTGQPGGRLWDGFIRQDVEIELHGGGRSTVSVEYGTVGLGGGDVPTGVTPTTQASPPGGGPTTDPGAALDPGYSFTVSTATEKITQSLRVVSSGGVGGAGAPDPHGIIGLTETGVEGTDRFAPQFEWTRSVVFPYLTTNHLKLYEEFVGRKKNGALFYGRAAGEVLLLAVNGGPGEGGKFNVSFRFGVRKNVTNRIVVPDPADPTNPAAANALTVTSARGWDHIEFKYKKAVESGQLAPRPFLYYVHEIYEDGDYSQLGIGT